MGNECSAESTNSQTSCATHKHVLTVLLLLLLLGDLLGLGVGVVPALLRRRGACVVARTTGRGRTRGRHVAGHVSGELPFCAAGRHVDVVGAAEAGLPLLGPFHGKRRGRDGRRTSGRRRAGVGRTGSGRVEAALATFVGRTRSRGVVTALAAFVGRPVTVWGTVVGRALRRGRTGVVSLWRGALIGRAVVRRTLVTRTVIRGPLRGRTTLVGRTVVWRTLVWRASAVVGFLWWGVVRHGGCGRIRKLGEGSKKDEREEENKGRMKDP